MVFPARGIRYDLNPTDHAVVNLEDSGRYSVRIIRTKWSRDVFSSITRTIHDLSFDSLDQVKEYLFEYADADHKDQFKHKDDKDEKAP